MPKLATLRRPIALFVAAGLHLAILGAGFWSASHEPVPKEPTVVTVLTGHVAADGTGDFEATGFRQARVAQR